jgi:predicted transglutaminase-like protease
MIVFHCLNIKLLAKFNRNVISKISQIYNPNCFSSISLLKNEEIFPGKNKIAKKFTVFVKESAVLCHCYLNNFSRS